MNRRTSARMYRRDRRQVPQYIDNGFIFWRSIPTRWVGCLALLRTPEMGERGTQDGQLRELNGPVRVGTREAASGEEKLRAAGRVRGLG